MIKPSYFILLPLLLSCSCSLFKPAEKSPKGSVSSSRFLEDISVTPGAKAESKTPREETLPDLEDDHRVPLNFNTGISISEAIPEQFRYAILLNTEVEYLSNKELYKLIHNWWGTPYKIGGMTQRGIDCSAFVQTIMAGAYEVALPRTAREQKDFCKGIDRSELKEGDLVFFNTRGGVSHVGIYLHNNKFVHASTSGGVTISDLNETYWAGRYLGAGRVATEIPVLLFILLLCYSACTAPRADDRQVFRYNQPEGLTTLDPAFAKSQPVMWISHQLYSTLVEIDSNLRIAPSLAKRWEVSANGLHYLFTLRDSVRFHDDACFPGGKGRLLKASDVVFSLGRIMDKETASPGAWIFNGRVDSLKPFEAPNDSTVLVHLAKPFPPILGILSMQYCSVLAPEAVKAYGKDIRRHPVGTGPSRFVNWEEGQALILHRNPYYFERDDEGRRLPYLDAVKVSFLDNKATEFMEFRQGRLDFVNDIEASFKDEVLTKKGELKKEWEGRIRLFKKPYLNTEYLGIYVDPANTLLQRSPLRLRKIRQAMNHAIDRKKMMMYLRNSIGTAAESGFVPAGLPSFDTGRVRGYTYDPDKARALLREAGYDGSAITLKTIPIYAELGAFVARQMEEVGINVKLETVQRATLLEEMAKGQALFFRGSWIADYPDAENYLSVFYSKNPAPPNYTRYKNPEFDRLYDQALTVTDDSTRYRIYQRMDQLIMDDAPVIPLWYDMAIHLVQPGIAGFSPNSLNLLELRRAKKVLRY